MAVTTNPRQVTDKVMKGKPAEVGAFGCNGKTGQDAWTLAAAVAVTGATNSSPYGFTQAQANAIIALVNDLRAMVVANGQGV